MVASVLVGLSNLGCCRNVCEAGVLEATLLS